MSKCQQHKLAPKGADWAVEVEEGPSVQFFAVTL